MEIITKEKVATGLQTQVAQYDRLCSFAIARGSNFLSPFGSREQLWCLNDKVKAVGNRLGSCFELLDRRFT